MTVSQGLARMGQRQAEALMESVCVITRRGVPVTDHATGQATTPETVIYTGKCRLRFPFVRPQQALVDGQVIERARGILSLPISDPATADVHTNDVATITANTVDPGIVGLTVRVEGVFLETHPTSRRVPVEVIS